MLVLIDWKIFRFRFLWKKLSAKNSFSFFSKKCPKKFPVSFSLGKLLPKNFFSLFFLEKLPKKFHFRFLCKTCPQKIFFYNFFLGKLPKKRFPCFLLRNCSKINFSCFPSKHCPQKNNLLPTSYQRDSLFKKYPPRNLDCSLILSKEPNLVFIPNLFRFVSQVSTALESRESQATGIFVTVGAGALFLLLILGIVYLKL